MGKTKPHSSGMNARTRLRRYVHAKQLKISKARFESEDVQKMLADRLDEILEHAAKNPTNAIDADVGVITDEGDFVPSSRSFEVDTTSNNPVSSQASKAVGDPNAPAGISQQFTLDAHRSSMFNLSGAIPPPWDLHLQKILLTSNVVHAAAVETKAADYAYSGWHLELRPEVAAAIEKKTLDEEMIAIAEAEVTKILETCFGDNLAVEDMCRDMALEYEGLGTSALEIIRKQNGLLHTLEPITFTNLRFLNKAVREDTTAKLIQIQDNNKRYFVKFGDSVLYDGEPDPGKGNEVDHTFDPFTANFEDFPDFDKRAEFIRLRQNHVKVDDPTKAGKWPSTAATELLVLPRRPFTLSQMYGTPSGIQAQGSVLALRRIEEYNLQFFSSKGVPQYAIMVKGLTVPAPTLSGKAGNSQSDPSAATRVRNTIKEFFTNKLVAADRSVLVLTAYGNTEVEFKKLSSESIEGSFAEYETRMTESIRMSHMVPPAALGIAETANLGGGRDTSQLKRYRDHIIIPGQRQFANVVNQIIRAGLLIPYFDFKFDPVDINEEAALRDYWLKAFVDGAISPDELRTRVPSGLELLGEEKGGESLYIRTGGALTVINPRPLEGEDMNRALQLTEAKARKRIKQAVDEALEDETVGGNGHGSTELELG